MFLFFLFCFLQANRTDILCCIKLSNEPQKSEGCLFRFFKKIYAPFILKDWVRPLVVGVKISKQNRTTRNSVNLNLFKLHLNEFVTEKRWYCILSVCVFNENWTHDIGLPVYLNMAMMYKYEFILQFSFLFFLLILIYRLLCLWECCHLV